MIKKKKRKGNVTHNLPAPVYPPGRGLPGCMEVLILFSYIGDAVKLLSLKEGPRIVRVNLIT